MRAVHPALRRAKVAGGQGRRAAGGRREGQGRNRGVDAGKEALSAASRTSSPSLLGSALAKQLTMGRAEGLSTAMPKAAEAEGRNLTRLLAQSSFTRLPKFIQYLEKVLAYNKCGSSFLVGDKLTVAVSEQDWAPKRILRRMCRHWGSGCQP